MGKFQTALKYYSDALKVNPNYPSIHVNIGVIRIDENKLPKARECFKKALSINPTFTSALWNLLGTADTLIDAKNYLIRCIKIDKDHISAKLTLALLEAYEGNRTMYESLNSPKEKNHPITRSIKWFLTLPNKPKLYFNRWHFFDELCLEAESNRPFYEFGVWKGSSFKHLIKTFKKGYGFDTFTGLPENWHHEKIGTYSSDGNIPSIKGGIFIKGEFKDSLPKFFETKRPMASIINFDADLYSSTKCALENSDPVIDGKTILIFDEFIVNENWEQDEYKALNEFCSEKNYSYDVIGVSFFTKQVAVKINK